MKPRVLIVDDSATVRMDLTEALEEAGIAAFWSATASAARQALARVAFDVVILDVLLPDGDGLDLLRDIKSSPATSDLPVMMLSSEADVADRVLGLGYGADEYLGKPYHAAHVVARVRALWRGRLPKARAKPLVLVVDDSRTFRDTMSAVLEGSGYEPVEAPDGEEGLRAAAALRPDAVLVDQKMPGLHGTGFLRALRADSVLRRTPCLLLTAAGDPDAEARALDSGADAFLPKDGDMELLVARLKGLLPPSGEGEGLRAPGPSLLGPKRLLVVDGGRGFLAELAERLRGETYDVVTASSGEDALALLAAQDVDALLMDAALPGLSGDEVCRRVKAHALWRRVPVLLFKGAAQHDAVLSGIQAGADDVLSWSEDFHVLRARLQARLRRRQFEDENRAVREQMLRREMESLELRTVRELAEGRAAHIAELEARNRTLTLARDEALALVRELEALGGGQAGAGAPDSEFLDRALAGLRRVGLWMEDLLAV